MYAVPRVWWWGLAGGLAAATATNLALSGLDVEHDSLLILLIGLATAAVATLGVEALADDATLSWSSPVRSRPTDDGEDLRTEELRWLVETHLTRRSTDESVVWHIADLARRRMRQLHGPSSLDDPARVAALLGPQLAEWMSHDRRHRYDPAHRYPRYSLAQLAEALRRIEEL